MVLVVLVLVEDFDSDFTFLGCFFAFTVSVDLLVSVLVEDVVVLAGAGSCAANAEPRTRERPRAADSTFFIL